MPLAWADVVERNEFKGLSAEEQASAREQYFLEVVAPRVPREELAAARRQFDAETYIRKRELPAGVAPSGAGGGRGGQGGPDPDTMPLGERVAQATAAAVRQPLVEPRPVGERRGGTRREMQPYGAGDERVAAPPPMTPGRMLEQPAPEDQRAPGLTPMEQLEGSVAPWRLQQVRDEAAYLDRSRGPQATPLTPAQEVVADIRDATGNPVARGAVAGVAQLAQTGIGALRGAADAVGADAVSRFAQRASSTATSVGQDATMGLRGAQKLAADVTNSILNSAPALAMGVAGGPAMRTLFAQTAAADYAETGNAAHAGIQAAAEVIGERFGFGEQVQLLKGALRGMPSGDVARVLGSLIAKEIPGEQLTTALQFLGDKVGPGARNPGATFADYLQQAGETLELTVAQTAVMGGGPAVLQTTANAQRAGDAAIARSAQPLAERAARDVGFLAPAQQRRETVRRLDDFAAQHGLSPAATKAVKQRAETLPLDQVPGYFRRALQALARRGVYRGPVDDAALAALDAPPAQPAPTGDRDAAVPDAGGADLRRAPSPGAADAGAAADAAGAGAAADDFTGLDTPALAGPPPAQGAPAGAGAAVPEAAGQPAAIPAAELIDDQAEPAPAAPAAPAAPVAGQPLNRNWTAFAPESGTLGIPRADMPQVAPEHRGALVRFLAGRGIAHQTEEVDPASLRPTQAEFSPRRVAGSRESGGDRAVLVSQDGHVIDGTHQWLAALEDGRPVKVIRLDAPVQDLLRLAHQFPSSTTSGGATRAPAEKIDVRPQPDLPAAPAVAPAAAAGRAPDGGGGQPALGRGADEPAKVGQRPAEPAGGAAAAASARPGDRPDAALTAQAERFPPVSRFTSLSAGPGGRIEPRPIAAGAVLYRETNAEGLDDLLRLDGQADLRSIFVADRPELAIGQGDNRGVRIEFRPDALSGREHRKPAPGDLAGREYRTDIVAPRAIQRITMPAADARRLRGLTKRVLLAEFDRTAGPDGSTVFVRKGLAAASPPAAPATAPAAPVTPRVIASLGRTPGDAKPIELRPNADGTVTPYSEGQPMLDFDTGEPITMRADISALGAVSAIRAAGAVSSRQRFFKVAADDAAPPEQADQPAPAPAGARRAAAARPRRQVDPERDTLLQALAKMGGLKREVAAREWGMRLEELRHAVTAGGLRAYPFRASGGMGLDGALEALREAGYFRGVPDDEVANAFEAAVFDEIGGRPTLTAEGQVRQAQERAGADEEAQRDEAWPGLDPEAAAEAAAEREAIMAEAGLSRREADALLDDDIDWAATSTASTERAMRELGFSEQEIADETARQAADRPAQAGSGEARPAGAGEETAPGGAGGAEARARPAGADEEGLTLEAQTPEALRDKAVREDAARRADAEEQQRLERRARADAMRDEFVLTGSDRPADEAAARGQGGLFDAAPRVEERGKTYGVKENEPYDTDLFGNPLPSAGGRGSRRPPRSASATGNVAAASDLRPPAGRYATRTALVTSRQQQLGAKRVVSLADAANALAYLRSSAVERFDAIVTDAAGRPLSVIGGFKGALSQASVYPSTLLGEALNVPGARKVWMVHNHPSGNPMLSRADTMLAESMRNAFDGTGVEVMGIVAVGADEWGGAVHDGRRFEPNAFGRLAPIENGPTVPVQEREIVERGKLGGEVLSPAAAKDAVAALVSSNMGRPTIVLMDAQNRPVAAVPWSPEDALPMRGNGKIDALLRAVAHANAAAAIIGAGDPSAGGRVLTMPQAMNIGAGLAKMDVRVLDIIDHQGTSAAERGLPLQAPTMLSRGGSGSSETQLAAQKKPPGGTSGAASATATAPTLDDQPAPGGDTSVAPAAEKLDRSASSMRSAGAFDAPMTLAQAKAIAADMRSRGLVDVSVVQSVGDMPPAERRRVLAQAPDGRARGAYFRQSDRIYLVMDEIRDPLTFNFVLLHEAFHRGLARTIPEARPLLRDMHAKNRALQRATRVQMKRHGIGLDEAIEEALADMAGAGTAGDLTGWPRLLELIRGWLARMGDALGIRIEWTDRQVADFVAGVRREGLIGATTVQPGGPAAALQRVWHGTPHRGIERFSTDRIGTGEGAQAYGWGLYFAAKKEIAEHYRKTLSRGVRLDGLTTAPATMSFVDDAMTRMFQNRKAAGLDDKVARDQTAEWAKANRQVLERYTPEQIDSFVRRLSTDPGQLYQVEIPEDSELLLWDKPLKDQPADVRAALERMAAAEPDQRSLFVRAVKDGRTGEVIYRGLSQELAGPRADDLKAADGAPAGWGAVTNTINDQVVNDRAASLALLAAGVRGLKYLDGSSRGAGDGSHNYVVFDGADTEVTGVMLSRSGPQRTPEEEKALRRAGIGGPPTAREKLRRHWQRAVDLVRDRGELADALRQGALDQFYGIQRAVRREIGGLPLEQDPYVTARLANGGTSGVLRGLMLHGQARWAENGQHLEKVPGTQGLLDILQPLGGELNDWFGWMIGNRAARLMREGRENNFSAADIAALQGLAKTPEQLTRFRKAAMEYTAFKRSVLDVAQAAGLINPESRAAWDHADYIPFYREMDERGAMSPTGRKGLSGQSSGIRTLKGGESALNDPMENLLMNFSRLIDASLKNNALRRTVEVLRGKDIVEKIGYDMRSALIPADQVRRRLAEAGTPLEILDVLPPEVFTGMAKMWAIQPPADPNVVRVMVGGRPQFYRVHDPLLLRALTSFVPFDFPGLAVMRGAKRLLTAMVTSTPEFMLRNWIRDSTAVQAIARGSLNTVSTARSDGSETRIYGTPLTGLARSVSGIAKSYRGTGGAEAMLFAGASFQSGYVNAADPEATGVALRRALRQRGYSASAASAFAAKFIDTPARAWELYREVNEAVENANREAVFEATMRDGSGTTAASYEAKDLMDFSLRGSWPIYQFFADVLPFFNARVQGLYRLGRSDPKRLAIVGGMLMFASLALAFANDGEDWYEELPDWDKDTNWHFRLGGHHFRLPKPFEIGVVFATIPERTARYIKGLDTGKKTASRVWAGIHDQLAFDPVPQAFRPVLNVWANWDTFRDAPIESQADEGKPPHARYSPRTSDTTRVLAGAVPSVFDATGLSPKRLEYLVGGYFGTAGLYALGLSDLLVRQLEGKPPGPALRADDIPVVRAFYRVDPARATVFESDLYKVRQDVEQVFREINALKREGEDAKAAARATEEREKLAARPAVVSATGAIAALNRQRDRIYADRTMSREEKRRRIDELQVKKNAIAKRAMQEPAVRALQ